MNKKYKAMATFILGMTLWGAVLLWLLPNSPAYAQSSGRIEGHITNLTTNAPPSEPLPSVEVLVNDWMVVRSGSGGEWNITGLKPGVYSVRLNLPAGYSPAQDVITTTIWGDNIEVIDLFYYEGDVSPVAATTTTELSDRVTPLGQTQVATSSTETEDVITANEPSTIAEPNTALPGRAGLREEEAVDTMLLWVWGATGIAGCITALIYYSKKEGK